MWREINLDKQQQELGKFSYFFNIFLTNIYIYIEIFKRLVLAHEPGPMEAPIVKEYSDTEILLRWDHPKHDGNAPILCYQLEVRENGKS